MKCIFCGSIHVSVQEYIYHYTTEENKTNVLLSLFALEDRTRPVNINVIRHAIYTVPYPMSY